MKRVQQLRGWWQEARRAEKRNSGAVRNRASSERPWTQPSSSEAKSQRGQTNAQAAKQRRTGLGRSPGPAPKRRDAPPRSRRARRALGSKNRSRQPWLVTIVRVARAQSSHRARAGESRRQVVCRKEQRVFGQTVRRAHGGQQHTGAPGPFGPQRGFPAGVRGPGATRPGARQRAQLAAADPGPLLLLGARAPEPIPRVEDSRSRGRRARRPSSCRTLRASPRPR